MRLFLSADIVGSTAYKNKRQQDDGKPSPRSKPRVVQRPKPGVQPWLETFNSFYEDLPRSLNSRYRPSKDNRGPTPPTLWKTLGDEVVFVTELSDRTHANVHIRHFRSTLRAYRKVLERADDKLNIKGTAWLAGFPVGNSKMTLTDSASGRQWPDFIGPSMDIGFRLKDFAGPRRIAVSVELAYLLAIGDDGANRSLRLHLADAVPLKGVIGHKPYPAFWIDAGDSGRVDDLVKLERPLRRPAPWPDVRAYCKEFILAHSPPLFLPFIEGDPSFNEKPPGYERDLHAIGMIWSQIASSREPAHDDNAGPPKPVGERLAEADELQSPGE